ncbi:hypothetical protein WICMUC_004177 [Wickerhamomyces mucosus]|uniref:ER transporter 6TM N-terminal domain-containing protein n=1 Tax=Wickerhamomyces mucosus TaxID=1378264 RepID=A0A9P8TC18_9ASCO|nr:hypothetical protein WICMUC_004177 [Wickerhamomyces mucosus]
MSKLNVAETIETSINQDPIFDVRSHQPDRSGQDLSTMRMGAIFQKDETNLLKQSLTSNSHITNHLANNANDGVTNTPRTSMSQLKLFELSQKFKEKEISDLGVNELRDGFFDPIYNKPSHLLESKHNEDQQEKSSKTENQGRYVSSSALIELYRSFWKNKIIITKFTFAYFLAVTLSVIHKSSSWFGPFVTFLPISTLINHPVHSIGVQIEITIQSIFGLAIGLGWSSLSLYISKATQPTRNHPGGILAGSLFLGLFVMSWFKAQFIRLYYMLLSSGFVLIFLFTNVNIENPSIDWEMCWNIGIPYLFGLLISLFVSLTYFPLRGDEILMDDLLSTTGSIKSLLIELTNAEAGNDSKILKSQKEMVKNTLSLSDSFREFLSFFQVSKYRNEDLKKIRNHINFVTSPLRVIPSSLKIKPIENINAEDSNKESIYNSADISKVQSGIVTPLPKESFSINQSHLKNELVYLRVMDEFFNKPLFKLLNEMVICITLIETALKSANIIDNISKNITELEKAKLDLKSLISKVDQSYKRFCKSEYFVRDLLKNDSIINIFLLLRYSRHSAVVIVGLIEVIINILQKPLGVKIQYPTYPLKRSLRRLSKQCLKDQGADSVYHYFESKIDVDDAFERIYNLNTSKTQGSFNSKPGTKIIRAIDHSDFNFHSTENKFRYRLWKFLSLYKTLETKYAFKVSFVTVMLALPGWLPGSYRWYKSYQAFWGCWLVYFLLSPRNSSSGKNLATRLISWVLCCFIGWVSNLPSIGAPVLIGAFSIIICLPLSYTFLVSSHPRSSLVGLLSFTIVSLNSYVENNNTRLDIWKHTWISSLSILVGIITSVLINWIIWPFLARKEIFTSIASVLSHIGQSYQSISERYLYRDLDDDPTDLTLELANIREVRMSQSLKSIRELLEKAGTELDFTHSFHKENFNQLLESCEIVFEKIIEARVSGIYFNANKQDDNQTNLTKELLAVRRDSVATVIYIFYVLSNSFRSKSKIPKYLPSTISIRKRLYDLIGELELKKLQLREKKNDFYDFETTETLAIELTEKLNGINSNSGKQGATDDKSYLKTYWTEVHGMSFARAYTTIAEELEKMILLSKEIMGEENIFE